jgi:hypothetical protein
MKVNWEDSIVGVITRQDNGWTLYFEGNTIDCSEVFMKSNDCTMDDDEASVEAIRNLLYCIMENCLYFYNSKHNAYRVNIEVEKQ